MTASVRVCQKGLLEKVLSICQAYEIIDILDAPTSCLNSSGSKRGNSQSSRREVRGVMQEPGNMTGDIC